MDFKTLKDVPTADRRVPQELAQEVFGDVSVAGASIIHALILSAGGSITVPRDVFSGATKTSLFIQQDFDTGAITYKVVKEQ